MENKILAKVNEKEITQQDIDFIFSNLSPQIANQFIGPEGEKRLLDEAINQNLLLSHAKDTNVENDADFKNELEKMKENLLSQFVIRKVLQNVTVSDSEAKKFYESNLEHFKIHPQVRASHILVNDETKANELFKKISNNGNFEELAKENSSCPSASVGGDLNFFGRGQMVPEFENMAFSLNIGEVSKPVKTQFGYHIIKLTDKKDESIQEFSNVKNSILQNLTAQKQHEAYNELIKNLKSKVKIEIF